MNLETVERDGQVHVFKNGVEAQWFIMPDGIGYIIYEPRPIQHAETLEEAIVLITEWMDTWYTSTQAAARLAELGAYDKAPSRQTITRLCQAGAFPGAFKLPHEVGSGGQWRIPEDGVMEHARRMGK